MNDHVHFMTILCSVLIYYACFMAVLEHRSMIIVFIEQRHAQESRLVHITHSQPSLAFSQEPPWVPSCLFSAGFFSARGPAETLTLVERAVTGNLGKWLIVDTFFYGWLIPVVLLSVCHLCWLSSCVVFSTEAEARRLRSQAPLSVSGFLVEEVRKRPNRSQLRVHDSTTPRYSCPLLPTTSPTCTTKNTMNS